MKYITASFIVAASIAAAGYASAQDTDQPGAPETTVEAPMNGGHFKHGPVDLEKFSRMDDLKAADTNGDGTLSREEIEAHALKQMVKRMADRMEQRLDVNGDGTVTLDEIQKQKAKEFAALDRNDDGKLDRKELRAAKHGWHGKHSRHGGQHHRAMQPHQK